MSRWMWHNCCEGKGKKFMNIDTNCPQILSSRGAIKSPIYDHVEQQQKCQEKNDL